MRWLVQVSPLAGSGRSDTVAVEGPNWRSALEQARMTRGEPGSIGGFHVEVSADAYQVVDPRTKQRYEVRADSAKSDGGTAVASTERASRARSKTIEQFPPSPTTEASGAPSDRGARSGDFASDSGLGFAADTERMQAPVPPPSTEATSPGCPPSPNLRLREPSIEMAPTTSTTCALNGGGHWV